MDAKEKEIKDKEKEIKDKQNELDQELDKLDTNDQFAADLQQAFQNADCDTTENFDNIKVTSGQGAGIIYKQTFYCKNEADIEKLIKELEKFWETHDRPANEDQIWDDIFDVLDELDDLQDELDQLDRELYDLLEKYLDCLDLLASLPHCPVPAMSDTSAFSDTLGHWADLFIQTLKNMGVVSGNPGGGFDPNTPINRAEVAKIFSKLFGLTTPDCTEKPFSDVNITDWFCKYIQAAKKADIFEGYNDGTFRPGNLINRAEGTTSLLRALKVQLRTMADHGFGDITSGAWFETYINTAKYLGIISGKTTLIFDPAGLMTRAEFTKIGPLR